MDEGAGAHRTGFFGHEKVAIRQAPVTDAGFRLRQGEHLGMGGGILEQLDLVEGARNDFPVAHHHSADWNLLRFVRAHGHAQRLTHEIGVALQVDDRFHATICFENVSSLGKEL